jgi:hypothetical protein
LEVRTLEPRVAFAILGAPAATAAPPVAMSESLGRLLAVLDRISTGAPPSGQAAASMASGAAAMPPTLPGPAAPAAAIAGGTSPLAPAAQTATPMHAASSAAPVLASPPHDATAFAESLRTALGRSGLFYESHQAQWVAGERPLQELMREPQAGLKSIGEPIHPQTFGVVRQQLEVLDTRQLAWHGQIWPDQPLEWRIEEEAQRHGGADAAPVWKTSLRLTLPRLGDVSAALSIQGHEIRLVFSGLAGDAESAVRNGQVALRDALSRAGLTLTEIKLDRHET